METILLTSLTSILAALIAAGVTSILTRRREHEAEWRKLKHACYQEYISAMSEIVEGRSTVEAQRRFANAVNGLILVAPEDVLLARDAFLRENSVRNPSRSQSEHDRLLNVLLRAMRQDIHKKARVSEAYEFYLQAPPPGTPPS
ncbi:hypothetical protein ANOBCDAF_03422 [Pleomorphomonas sp. T1.2MG-36]|uniref:hypothetical protein n=1 Tax=Pleomorphomonas sp. T1.2MG-36 TaxID=3041167 RepID=UPI0024775FD9|nr:hypothetical protein [Pleomorphomonas sp. T1.2MG-36]CAI9415277.1 hypothetical protein ANOBCDAF_03422 [Pleomorphomonas sp. T1.2MG-36]